jgi:hypothetical protein
VYTSITVDSPAVNQCFTALDFPDEFTGTVTDSVDGIPAGSVEFTITRGNESWNGTAWTNDVTWLPAANDAVTGSTEWSGNFASLRFENDTGYELQARVAGSYNWKTYSGTVPFSFSLPEIGIDGKRIRIVNGDDTPSSDDGTDFGSVITSGSVKNTFSINNTGTSN